MAIYEAAVLVHVHPHAPPAHLSGFTRTMNYRRRVAELLPYASENELSICTYVELLQSILWELPRTVSRSLSVSDRSLPPMLRHEASRLSNANPFIFDSLKNAEKSLTGGRTTKKKTKKVQDAQSAPVPAGGANEAERNTVQARARRKRARTAANVATIDQGAKTQSDIASSSFPSVASAGTRSRAASTSADSAVVAGAGDDVDVVAAFSGDCSYDEADDSSYDEEDGTSPIEQSGRIMRMRPRRAPRMHCCELCNNHVLDTDTDRFVCPCGKCAHATCALDFGGDGTHCASCDPMLN